MPTINELSQAILALSPGSEYTLRGEDLDNDLEWFEGDRPTNTAILNKVTELAALANINWGGLLQEFLTPGNALYESVLDKAIATGNLAYHRFQNLQQVLSNPGLQSPQGLAFAISQLSAALTGDHALSTDDITAWNDLIDTYGFPPACKLPV